MKKHLFAALLCTLAACRRALAAIKTWLDPEFDPGYIYEEDYKREAEAAAFNKKQCL